MNRLTTHLGLERIWKIFNKPSALQIGCVAVGTFIDVGTIRDGDIAEGTISEQGSVYSSRPGIDTNSEQSNFHNLSALALDESDRFCVG